MKTYDEEASKIKYSVLKKERPKNERNFINFRNKNDSNYKICYENETIKLIELNENNLVICIKDKQQIVDYNSSPKKIIHSLFCIETVNFTKENSKIFRKFIQGFIDFHYNPSYLDEIRSSKINVDERIKNFKDSKANFIKITNRTINLKENLANDLVSTSNAKKLQRLNSLKSKLNLSDLDK